MYWISIGIATFDLDPFKRSLIKVMHILTVKVLAIVRDNVTIIIAVK